MLTRDEVITRLGQLGVSITTRTLRRYEEQKLIPDAIRGIPGLKGRSTRYPEEAVDEAYAAWAMFNGWNAAPEFVPGERVLDFAPRFSPTAVALARAAAKDQCDFTDNEKLLAIVVDKYGTSEFIGRRMLEEPRMTTFLAYAAEVWKANIKRARFFFDREAIRKGEKKISLPSR